MKLKDLINKELIQSIKEDMEAPPEVYFYVPPVQQVVNTIAANQDNFYTEKDVDFSKMNNIQQFTITKDFINFIKEIENAGKKGYDKRRNIWFPHESPEGGLKTVGYGHKIKSAAEQRNLEKTGLTNQQVEELLIKDLTSASRRAKDYVQRRFSGAVLDQTQMEMLTEFAFNLGSLDGFPKFTEAVVKGDWNIARKEYHRNYTDKQGVRQRLDTRNTAFFNRYLSNR
jgi:GH24 family phage-related lysozyme (muramidase)